MTQHKRHIRLVAINGRFVHSCLALFYVRNELVDHCPEIGWSMQQYAINDNYHEMLLRITDDAPYAIFFSAAIWNSSLIEQLIADLRKLLPQIVVVVGGPQALVVQQALPPGTCSAVAGAVEDVDPAFYRHLVSGELQAVYRPRADRTGGPAADYSFPYKGDDFSVQLVNRHIYYESSRGCPFQCSYCLSAARPGVGHKELATVREELALILEHRPAVVRFIDRTFNDLPERALAIWRFLAQQGGSTLFHFEMAPDRFSEEMFDFLATMPPGKFQFEIGIQSTSAQTLEAIRRRTDVGLAAKNVRRLASMSNVHLHVDLILGLPFEDESSFAASFTTVFAMGAHYIQMGLLKILPGTPIAARVAEFGYIHSAVPPYSVYRNRWLSPEAMTRLYWFSECVERFYNNRYFLSLWQYLRDNGLAIFTFFAELTELCRLDGWLYIPQGPESLFEKMAEFVGMREDGEFMLELLRYDWLRCGYRFLPQGLGLPAGLEDAENLRSRLYQSMPQELAGHYNRAGRNYFFRKSFFLPVSSRFVTFLGLEASGDEQCLCVLPDKEEGLISFNKVLLLPRKWGGEKKA